MLRFIVPAALVLTACGSVDSGPREGDSCTAPSFRCAEAHAMLECVHGQYRRVTCNGPDGCRDDGEEVTCDDREGQAGDPCMLGHEGTHACSLDGERVLRCESGAFVDVDACHACNAKGAQIQCSMGAGMACNAPSYACADDVTALECIGGSFAAVPCRGPSGCDASSHSLSCDTTVAMPGDACLSVLEGSNACHVDGNRSLVCRGGVWELHQVCTGCRVSGGALECPGAQ